MGHISVQTDCTSSGVIVNSVPDFLALALARSQAVLAGLSNLRCLEVPETQSLQVVELGLNLLSLSSLEHDLHVCSWCSRSSGLRSLSTH